MIKKRHNKTQSLSLRTRSLPSQFTCWWLERLRVSFSVCVYAGGVCEMCVNLVVVHKNVVGVFASKGTEALFWGKTNKPETQERRTSPFLALCVWRRLYHVRRQQQKHTIYRYIIIFIQQQPHPYTQNINTKCITYMHKINAKQT